MTKPPVDISKISLLISAEEIAKRMEKLATDIARDMPNDIMIVALLRGSFIFTADLIRALHKANSCPQVDFLTLSSYGADTFSSGKVNIIRDIAENVEGRDVLIIDDILESGRTLTFARDLLRARGVKSLKIAVLLEKPGKRKMEIDADYVGFTIPDYFVVGYGLDYANYYRELPYIGIVPS